MSEDSAKIIKDNPCEKITMMQQSSTEQRSTVDSRRHQNVSQSVSQCQQSGDSLSIV